MEILQYIASERRGYSETTVKRWFGAIPADSCQAQDLVFRKLYLKINEKWNKKYGWPLFKSLAEDDQYHFDSFHLMGSDNGQKEFDGLIQSVTKLIIDSLDEMQLVKSIDASNPEVVQFLTKKDIEDGNLSKIKGSIAKFECFLISESMLDEEYITLLRKIQELRSPTVAHRKSTKLDSRTQSLFDYFGIQHYSDKNVWSNLLTRINDMLNWLISTTA